MPTATKTVSLHHFLTEAQIQKAIELGSHKKILDEIIRPNMGVINEKLGQENDARYLAYAVVHVLIAAGFLTDAAI